jgi:hypothetical protein
VQNQFVNVGETGGLVALIFFIVVIYRCFGKMADARKAVEADPQKQWCLWFLGAALFSNVVAFGGVNYFDQSRVSWFMLLAMFSTLTVPILAETEKPAGAEAVSSPSVTSKQSRLVYTIPRHNKGSGKIARAVASQGTWQSAFRKDRTE